MCVCSVFLGIEPTANELRNSVLRYCEFAKSIFVRRPRLSYKSNIWYWFNGSFDIGAAETTGQEHKDSLEAGPQGQGTSESVLNHRVREHQGLWGGTDNGTEPELVLWLWRTSGSLFYIWTTFSFLGHWTHDLHLAAAGSSDPVLLLPDAPSPSPTSQMGLHTSIMKMSGGSWSLGGNKSTAGSESRPRISLFRNGDKTKWWMRFEVSIVSESRRRRTRTRTEDFVNPAMESHDQNLTAGGRLHSTDI